MRDLREKDDGFSFFSQSASEQKTEMEKIKHRIAEEATEIEERKRKIENELKEVQVKVIFCSLTLLDLLESCHRKMVLQNKSLQFKCFL